MNYMENILEIGCGHGFNTFVLSKLAKSNVIGIDISDEAISVAKKRYPNIHFKLMSVEKLNFGDQYFNKVYAIDVFEHVDDLNQVINEISRVLRRKGKLIVNIPAIRSELFLLRIRPTYFNEIHHVRVFKENELEETLKEKRFILIKKKKTGFLQHIELLYLFKRRINSNTQESIGSWRDNIFTKSIHVAVLYFDPFVLKTPLIFFPIWIITIPIGWLISFFGNYLLPKSVYYEFIKQ